MNKFVFLLLMSITLLQSQSCTNSYATNADKNTIDKKVEKLLATMTLEDKVGEMTQLSIDMISVGDPYNLAEPHTLDKAKMHKALVELKVGSILNCGGHTYTREHWHEIMTAVQDMAMKEKKSGIPVLYGIDAIHGTNYTVDGTLSPQQIGLAATWNPDIVEQCGKVTAYETRASYIPWDFSPVLDIGRDARWSRFWETFGEDVFLAKTMGRALVKGYQGDDISDKNQVAACMKHFLGYSQTITGKDRTQAWIPERQLREYFMPTFEAAIEQGAATVMICSGEINGIPVHADSRILKDLLRDEMGFEGLAVTDWEDIGYLVSRHRVAKDYKEAIKMSINAGIDMAMVPMDLKFPVLLKELVEEGEVSMERIDESVSRILALKYRLGLFEKPFYAPESYPDFGGKKHAQYAFEAALESITLLKNDNNILPLDKNAKVLVSGPTAHSLNALNGGWTHTWQGAETKYNPKDKLDILQAIEQKVGKENVTFVEGASIDKVSNITEAVAAAKTADVAIVCLGEMTYCEVPGNIDELDLPDAQIALIEAIAETGTPVVLVLAEGRPRIVREAEAQAEGVVMAYLPGNEGGRAIADVIFGDYNPNGKLPFTYPRFSNTLIPYDHKGTDQQARDFSANAFNPQWEFGHGLSYTTFEYADLALSSEALNDAAPIEISVKVTNTGKLDGKEVVQLYIADKVASITPSVKRLRGFEKIALKAGESKVVTFTIKKEDLAFVGLQHKWVTETGEFEVMIGEHKATFNYTSGS